MAGTTITLHFWLNESSSPSETPSKSYPSYFTFRDQSLWYFEKKAIEASFVLYFYIHEFEYHLTAARDFLSISSRVLSQSNNLKLYYPLYWREQPLHCTFGSMNHHIVAKIHLNHTHHTLRLETNHFDISKRKRLKIYFLDIFKSMYMSLISHLSNDIKSL